MNPAERAVLNDVLCSVTSNGVPLDAATRERVVEAVEGMRERRLVLALGDALRLMDYADFRNGNTHDGHDEGDVMAARAIRRLTAIHAEFSPAESAPATSTPQPPGETAHDPTCPRAAGVPLLLCRCGAEPIPEPSTCSSCGGYAPCRCLDFPARAQADGTPPAPVPPHD